MNIAGSELSTEGEIENRVNVRMLINESRRIIYLIVNDEEEVLHTAISNIVLALYKVASPSPQDGCPRIMQRLLAHLRHSRKVP